MRNQDLAFAIVKEHPENIIITMMIIKNILVNKITIYMKTLKMLLLSLN